MVQGCPTYSIAFAGQCIALIAGNYRFCHFPVLLVPVYLLSAFCVVTSSTVREVIFLGASPVLHPWCWLAANAYTHPDASSAEPVVVEYCGCLHHVWTRQTNSIPSEALKTYSLDRQPSSAESSIDVCLQCLWFFPRRSMLRRKCSIRINRVGANEVLLPISTSTRVLRLASHARTFVNFKSDTSFGICFQDWQSISFTFDLVFACVKLFALCAQKVPMLVG